MGFAEAGKDAGREEEDMIKKYDQERLHLTENQLVMCRGYETVHGAGMYSWVIAGMLMGFITFSLNTVINDCMIIAFFHSVRWHCTTCTERYLPTSGKYAGITINFQLECQ